MIDPPVGVRDDLATKVLQDMIDLGASEANCTPLEAQSMLTIDNAQDIESLQCLRILAAEGIVRQTIGSVDGSGSSSCLRLVRGRLAVHLVPPAAVDVKRPTR